MKGSIEAEEKLGVPTCDGQCCALPSTITEFAIFALQWRPCKNSPCRFNEGKQFRAAYYKGRTLSGNESTSGTIGADALVQFLFCINAFAPLLQHHQRFRGCVSIAILSPIDSTAARSVFRWKCGRNILGTAQRRVFRRMEDHCRCQ